MNAAALPSLSGEHRAKPVPPESHRLVADIDPARERRIFDLAKRKRVSDVHHHCEPDDLR